MITSVVKVVKKTPVVNQVAYALFTANKKGLFNPYKLWVTLLYLPRFFSEYISLKKSARLSGEKLKFKHVFPVLLDYSVTTINRHYWFQDIYVASKVIEDSKKDSSFTHFDIGSRIEGFITSLISARVKLIFADINLPRIPFPNVETTRIDLQEMSPEQFKGAQSVSSLHVLEHLGLGKYGDKIDAIGHRRIFSDFSRVLPSGCKLYLSSPVSKRPGIVFNAGRHLDPESMISDAVSNGFEVLETAIVQDDWSFDINPDREQLYESEYGCLILTLRKR